MSREKPTAELVCPPKLQETPVPPLPQVDTANADMASITYSAYRTGLSNHRTGLSEHRTSLSEYRTDLSTHRTDLSEYRTDLSTNRTEMSKRRTGMSFQRTRLSADRTLMSVIRTALALISFGFTIFQFFGRLQSGSAPFLKPEAPRNFGVALVGLGIFMLIMGIGYHLAFMRGLRAERARMTGETLIHGESAYPVSMTLIVAVLLLLLGLLAISSMVFNIGPFG